MVRKRIARIMAWAFAQAPFSRQQWVTVSISFVLAVTLWFLVTLNTQTYSTTVRMPLRLANFPGEYQLVSDLPDAINVEASGLGVKLLVEVFNAEDTLVIDYLNLHERPYFIAHENLALFDGLLEEGVKALSASPDSISFVKLKKASKKVPVVLATNWNLPLSYRLTGAPRLEPDSVLITGPVDSLARIQFWRTADIPLPLTDEATRLSLPLDTLPPFVVVPSAIRVSINPEPYTERTYTLPVVAAGLPRATELHFEPDSVRLRLVVPFRLADSVDIDDFQVQVDYNRLDPRSTQAIPLLSKQPAGVEIGGLSPQLVDYLIITKLK